MAEYIELEALKQRLENSPLFTNFGEDGYFILNGVIDIIKRQPIVKPAADVVEVRHGEWVYDQTTGSMYCSVCGVSACADECDYHLGKYCSYCGAKMVKKEAPEH